MIRESGRRSSMSELSIATHLEHTILAAGDLLRRAVLAGEAHGVACDAAISHFITSEVDRCFPDHGWLSEEERLTKPAGDSGIVWIIDPVDGSNNLYRGIHGYTVSISVTHNGEVILGAVYEPEVRRLFFARKGHGATVNGKRICVSPRGDLSDGVIALSSFGSFSHMGDFGRACFRRLTEGLRIRIS